MALVFGDELGVILEIESEAETTMHSDLSGRHRRRAFYNGGMRRPVSPHCKIEHVSMARQWDQESTLNVPRIGDPAHDYGTDGSSDDGHDEQGRAELCVRAEVLNTQREDRREHDGVEE